MCDEKEGVMWFGDTLFYDKPIDITIALPPEQVTLTPFFSDVHILMEVGGRKYDALVPTWTLSEDRRTVPALRAGRRGDLEIVYFPVSNEGRPQWVIPYCDLESILVK